MTDAEIDALVPLPQPGINTASHSHLRVVGYPAEQVLDHTRAAVRAALRARLAEPVQPVAQWQPIETAPRDGRLLLWWGGSVVLAKWLDNSLCKYPWAGWQTPSLTPRPPGEPTRWMPLPAAPGAAPTVQPVAVPDWQLDRARAFVPDGYALVPVEPVAVPEGCPNADEPRGCYRVRCQLGRKCVDAAAPKGGA